MSYRIKDPATGKYYRPFKIEHGVKYYTSPGTTPPSRVYDCIQCDLPVRVYGQWNEPVGRWLMAFTCEKCGTHQEGFVSEAAESTVTREVERKTRSIVND